jgi:ribosomal protein S18 acetylase RimI-like enzyme
MLAEAASWDRTPGAAAPPLEELLTIPQMANYIEGWGRAGDAGFIAEAGDEAVGACWLRRFSASQPGYGFLGEDVPGIGLAVRPAHRRRGVGTRLLAAVIELARERGIAALSLSVAQGNEQARRLYERAGFAPVGREGGSLTMRLDLDAE